ncbi:unnamed protein product [Arabidopsis thaliana]|uniref:(thale cress) hypothetical protein n=1 Tax=Arabidopsis thaliana TaxID=3702 RepID=A0A7G2E6U4_ARATH|nr:unnamed protein product [Arabidopsis thaliana]
MKLGLTILLNCYTDGEYTIVSTMLKELAFRVLAILLLYFNLGVKDYITAHHHEPARRAAGWAGMIFTSFSALDAALRAKHKKLRLFDEISIVSIYVALWAMFYSMFQNISIYFICICGVSTFVGLFNYIHRRSVGLLNEPPKPNEAMTSLLNAMKNEQESTQSLLAAAMILAVTEPENPSTLTLVNALKERYATAPSI